MNGIHTRDLRNIGAEFKPTELVGLKANKEAVIVWICNKSVKLTEKIRSEVYEIRIIILVFRPLKYRSFRTNSEKKS